MFTRFETKLALAVVRFRWWLLLLIPLAALGIASGVRFLHYNADYRVFFKKDDPQLLALESMQNTYSKEEGVLFLLAPKGGEIFTPEALQSVQRLTQLAWQLPYASRVDSIANYQHTFVHGDELVVEDLVQNASHLTAQQIARIRNIALNEPTLVNRLIAPQGHVAAVNVSVQIPGDDAMKETPEVIKAARELIAKIKHDYPGTDIYLSGVLALNNAFDEVGQVDMQTVVPLSFAAIVLGVLLLLRRLTALFSIFVNIILSIACAMGAAGWLGISLTSASVVAPTMILTLVVANGVHILVTFLQHSKSGLEKKTAMAESVRINLQPVFLTSLTTVLGFLSMNFSGIPPLSDLGNIVAMGVAASFLLSMTLLPALMTILPSRAGKTTGKTNTIMVKLSGFVIRHHTRLLWGMGIVIMALVIFVPRNEMNTNFINYFDKRVPFRVATDFAAQNLGGFYQISYSLAAGAAGGVSEPRFMHDVDKFVQWYRRQPAVVHVDAYTETMKRLNRNMHGDRHDWYRLPEKRELASQYLLLYEMSLPYGLDLTNQINMDKSATRVNIILKPVSTNEILSLNRQAQQWLRDNTPPAMHAQGTGPIVMFAHMVTRNVRNMLLGGAAALVAISLCLILALRSLKIGLLSIIPNVAPAAMGFGVWGLLVGEIGMALSVVVGMTLGIVVDDTIHFLSKYLRARREKGLNAQAAVRYAFSTVGSALWITSVVLVAGFSILAASAFRGNADMGLLTALILVFALAADFLFLPALLIAIDGRKDQIPVSDKAAADPVSP